MKSNKYFLASIIIIALFIGQPVSTIEYYHLAVFRSHEITKVVSEDCNKTSYEMVIHDQNPLFSRKIIISEHYDEKNGKRTYDYQKTPLYPSMACQESVSPEIGGAKCRENRIFSVATAIFLQARIWTFLREKKRYESYYIPEPYTVANLENGEYPPSIARLLSYTHRRLLNS